MSKVRGRQSNHIRAMGARRLDRLNAGPGFGNDFDVVLVAKDHGKPTTHQCLIVDYGDANAHACSSPMGR